MLYNKAIAAAASAPALKTYVEDVFSTYLYTGNGSTQTITNGIALGDRVTIAPGEAIGGGFFAGLISQTANGVATHALIVAPAATGARGTGYPIQTNLAWKTTNTTTAGTDSTFDGAVNSANMNNSSHPAAQFCKGLSIGGYTDWYLPARYELDIAYENLKPTTDSNSITWGINPYSVPERKVNRTAGAPAQTSVAEFQSGGAQAFVSSAHWSSTQAGSSGGWFLNFPDGIQSTAQKTTVLRVRAFRKVPINDPLLDAYRVTGEGGLLVTKNRTSATAAFQWTSEATGLNSSLESNSTSTGVGVTAFGFNSDGYTINTTNTRWNASGSDYVSWTFRKAAKFFDVVTYTGNGIQGRQIAHNLGSTPGVILVKMTAAVQSWYVWHRSVNGGSAWGTLNSTAAFRTDLVPLIWGDGTNYVAPTSTNFTVGLSEGVNESGATYVAYLFAHDAGGFGDSGNESVIKCGSYTGASPSVNVELGWEPQWLLIKDASFANNWYLLDNLRGIATGGNDAFLLPNGTFSEDSGLNVVDLTATGFRIPSTTYSAFNYPGSTYIYIAIRRGPMKTPTDATEVFNTTAAFDSSGVVINTGFPVDLMSYMIRTSNGNNALTYDRMRGGTKFLATSSTAAEANSSVNFDRPDSVKVNVGSTQNSVYWSFRRAPGFFDVVAYTGTGVAGTVSHNLGVAPELIIVKKRDSTFLNGSWSVYAAPLTATKFLILNNTQAGNTNSNYWNDTEPTATVFSVKDLFVTNYSGSGYIAYLFATCPGVSKVGSYTGTGTTLNIDCGFTNGARFVLIKRADSTGDWYVWDTARGIIAANDPYLLLNSTAIEVTNTDYIDPLSTGFQISSTAPAAINANGGSYIYLSIA